MCETLPIIPLVATVSAFVGVATTQDSVPFKDELTMLSRHHETRATVGACGAPRWQLLLGILFAANSLVGCATFDAGPGTLAVPASDLATHPELAPVLEGTEVTANGVIAAPGPLSPPSELAKVSLPRYRVAPPDILNITALRTAPKSPYYIQTGDYLQIVAPGAPPEQPVQGVFQVEPNGFVNLGATYDSVQVEGLSLDEARQRVSQHLSRLLPTSQVSIALLQSAGIQQVTGEHLIMPDGHINLGIYGSVYVANHTLDEVRLAVETHLSEFMEEPKVSVDVLVFNSKFFYIVTEGGGFGDSVTRIPVTGNETVLDAIAQVGGLQQVSSKKIWISRPSPKNSGCDQILPVDWRGITRGAATATKYQLMPGDRIFIAEDQLFAANSLITKVINPVERMFGFTLLSAQTIQFLQRFPRGLTF